MKGDREALIRLTSKGLGFLICALALSVAPAARADITSDWERCEQEVLPHLKESGSKATSPEEQYCVGLGYATGRAGERNLSKATQWGLEKSLSSGFAPAKTVLGYHYEKGSLSFHRAIMPTATETISSKGKNSTSLKITRRRRNIFTPLLPREIRSQNFTSAIKTSLVKGCRRTKRKPPASIPRPRNKVTTSRNETSARFMRMVGACLTIGGRRRNGIAPAPSNPILKENWPWAVAMSLASAFRESRAEAVNWFQKAGAGGNGQGLYFARHLSDPTNFIGFRNEEEQAFVINNKLRFGLMLKEPIGEMFRNSAERKAYISRMRSDVTVEETFTLWRMRKKDTVIARTTAATLASIQARNREDKFLGKRTQAPLQSSERNLVLNV